MTPPRRPTPFIYATWLSQILAGEQQCQWATWVRAHHQFTPLADDAGLEEWRGLHTALVRDLATAYVAAGYELFLEAQNATWIHGNATTLKMRPDLVVVKPPAAIVIDAKTGAPKDSHI